jgi:hypothetical protein
VALLGGEKFLMVLPVLAAHACACFKQNSTSLPLGPQVMVISTAVALKLANKPLINNRGKNFIA